MNRRDALKSALAIAAFRRGPLVTADDSNNDLDGQVMSVTGPIHAEQLGTTLPHEHVMVDFVGAERVSRDRYDSDEVFSVVLPHLRDARRLGCQTLVECTPAWIGRDPALLKRLSQAADLWILTNTGCYGAGQGKYLPRRIYEEPAEKLAAQWISEWRDGIEGTGIRPGFIKIGVDAGPLSQINQTLVRAAARTHLATGLTIAGHTGDGQAAFAQIDLLRDEGVAPAAWIWVHAQSENDPDRHLEAGRRGVWVEFDGISPESLQSHIALVANMRKHNLLDRTLISHDAGWYNVGEPAGGKFRPYDTLLTEFLPALRKAGFSDAEIRQLTITNPARAFSIGKRPV